MKCSLCKECFVSIVALILTAGFVPTPASAQIEWTLASGGNGHYYQLISNLVTWEQAQTSAASLTFNGFTGHLATLTSEAENLFIRDTFGTTGWIGLYQPSGSPEPAGGWTWVTGEAFQYTNWDTNEPNNLNGELYAEATGGFRWNDDGATVTNFYFVEFGTPAGNVATPEPVALAFAIPVLGVMAGRRPWRNKR